MLENGRRPMRRTLCLLAVAASLAVPSLGHAQTSTPNPAAVERFLAGKKHRDEGHCDLAIRELLESVKIEPSIGAHYNLGVCYEKTNKKAALANYQRAEEIAKERNDDRLREIRAQRADFLARTPHLRLALPQPLPPDTRVSVDGDLIPEEELQSETIYFLPPGEKETYNVRVTATGYDDQRLAVDKGVVKKNLLVTIVLKKQSDGSILAPRSEPKWGPFQFLGLGLIALGAVGITYSSVSYVSYLTREDNFLKIFSSATAEEDDCRKKQETNANQNCDEEISATMNARRDYNGNEDDARSSTALWLTAGIGGILAVGGGVALIVAGPRSEEKIDPGATAKAGKEAPKGPSFHFIPTITARQQGLSIVGTF